MTVPKHFIIEPEVASALGEGGAVVALESTLIAHGLPHPFGVETAIKAEAVIRNSGFRDLRVRHHGDVARIEVSPAEISKFLDATLRERIVAGLKEAGFKYISLDLEGYRSGSMNEVLLQIQSSAQP